MNKYYYLIYLRFKLINVYTLFLAIVVRHISCSLRIYFIIYTIVQPSSLDNNLKYIRCGLLPMHITTEYARNFI